MKQVLFLLVILLFSSCSQNSNSISSDGTMDTLPLNKVSIVSTSISEDQKETLVEDELVTTSESQSL